MATKKKVAKKVTSKKVTELTPNEVISRFMKSDRVLNYERNLLLLFTEVAPKVFDFINKTKFKTLESKWWGIAKLNATKSLEASIIAHIKSGQINELHRTLYSTILWLNNKKK